jgi:hypothetical protein
MKMPATLPRIHFPNRSLLGYTLLACLPALLLGCAAVKPEPFVKYRTAVQEAQSGIDAAMSANYKWTRAGFIESFARDPESRFSQLVIQPGSNYDWKLPTAPLCLAIKQTRGALAELNEAFAKYADLLARLAAGELVSAAKFDQLAKDVNRSASDALEALKLSAPARGGALFSAAASEVARLYLEHKRQGYLVRTIRTNQTNITAYSDLCVSLVQTIRGNIKSAYADRAEPIRKAWEGAAGEKRLKDTEAMLNLNEQFADAMRILQALETTYHLLPRAHADLAQVIENPKFDLDGVQQLYSSAKQLDQLSNELKKSE